MRLFHGVGLVLALLATAGCIHPYKLEVRQGNVVTREMIDKLKPGMTKNQVRFVLGTPLITDPFHANRWDYVYLYKKNAKAPGETRRLTVIFDGDTMARLEGDLAEASKNMPGEPRDDTVDNESGGPKTSSSSTTARVR